MATLTPAIPTVHMPDVGVSLSIQQQPLTETMKVTVHPCLAGPFILPFGYIAASPCSLPHTTTKR